MMERGLNVYDILEGTIRQYCTQLRKGGDVDEWARRFYKVIKKHFPLIKGIYYTTWYDESSGRFETWYDKSATVWVNMLIERALQHVNDETMWGVWYLRILREPTEGNMYHLDYKERHIRRFVRKFPKIIAGQIWEEYCCSDEFIGNIDSTALMFEARICSHVRETYGLSNRQSQVLVSFCTHHLGTRKEIAKKLFISGNTLKSHIRQIIKKMKVENITEAVDKAVLEASQKLQTK